MVSSSKSKEERRKEKLLASVRKTNKKRDWFTILVSAGVVVFIAVIGLFMVIQNNKDASESKVTASEVTPSNTINDGFTVTSAGLLEAEPYDFETKFKAEPYSAEETNVSMYVDYACPHCAEFEEKNLPLMTEWLQSGEIDSLSIHPLAFLSEYSVNAANAASCVAEYDPANFLKAHEAMTTSYESTPKGKTLVRLLKEAGVDTSVEGISACIRGGEFNNFVEESTTKAQGGPVPQTSLAASEGIQGTPAVFVNGQQYSGDPDEKVFAEFVAYIKQGGSIAEINENNENKSEIGVK
jgi:protein-disulfide isomerase